MSEDKAIHTLYERIGHLFCEQPYGELGRYLTYYAEDRLYLVFDLWYHGFFLVEAKSPKDAIEKVNCDKLTYLPKGATMSDYISRADAIEAVCSVVIDEFDVSPTSGYEVAEKALSALPSADTEWIPCSERLPKEGQMVLTTIRGHDVIISQDGETLEEAMERVWNEVCYVSVGFIGSDGWYGADGFPQIVHPIAWMPLPKPYREDGEA